MQHVRSIDQFFADAANGTLPAFSIVDPDFDAYSEENPQDIRKGESFAAEVINRVLHGKGWPHTLLIWVYDEHGGYYDHVPPPAGGAARRRRGAQRDQAAGARWRSCSGRSSPAWSRARRTRPRDRSRYDRYGFRVPAVIVSPYARPDYVCSEVLDHTSVLKLVEEKWNLPPLTARDAAASTPLDALDLGQPPVLPGPAAAARAQPANGAPGKAGRTAQVKVPAPGSPVGRGQVFRHSVVGRACDRPLAHARSRAQAGVRQPGGAGAGPGRAHRARHHLHTDRLGRGPGRARPQPAGSRPAGRPAAARAASPTGSVSLWLLGIGFVGYALWRLSEAAFGVTGEGNGAGPRLKSLGRADGLRRLRAT